MPRLPIRIAIGAQVGRLVRIRNDSWIQRSADRMPVYGPTARMQVYRSAHLMMLDVPDQLAADISDVAAEALSDSDDVEQMEADD